MSAAASFAPALFECAITHVRAEPVRSVFTYPSFMWLIDLDAPPRLPWPLRPLARFDARDHFAGTGPVRPALERATAAHGIDIRGGRVLILTQARVLGHVFNPLSVYWCHHRDGTPACVVAEVHNTYGGRHAYVLRTDGRGRAAAEKEFYVSPFLPVSGSYRLSLPAPDGDLALTVTLHHPGARRPFVARVRGERRPYTVRSLLGLTLRHPVAPLLGAARIRRRGLGLWLRGVPVVRHGTEGNLR
ncbi:DUF1365 domain-containing protein [Embleya sp. NPDC127516]|uniref:DUF1365 domain-containing protein n=1 Tax=Embleya sp. NPDC127516 TaxID=3363990 RepID=UPI0038073CD9